MGHNTITWSVPDFSRDILINPKASQYNYLSWALIQQPGYAFQRWTSIFEIQEVSVMSEKRCYTVKELQAMNVPISGWYICCPIIFKKKWSSL
jgi:hypothetical protein